MAGRPAVPPSPSAFPPELGDVFDRAATRAVERRRFADSTNLQGLDAREKLARLKTMREGVAREVAAVRHRAPREVPRASGW